MAPFLLTAALLIAFASSSLLVPVVRRVAIVRGWVDMPDIERKKHARPTPSIGGIAIVIGFALGLLSLVFFASLWSVELSLPHWAFFAGGAAMAVIGLYDDLHGLSFKRKFFFQILVAYLLLFAGYRLDVSGLPFVGSDPGSQALLAVPLTIIWIVGIINAVNLLDGLDGLASGVSMIAFASLASVFAIQGGDLGLIAVAILAIGAIAGFLVYNFNPASIFMGDAGSLSIGYLLAVYSLEGSAHAHPLLGILIPAVALGLPILDTALCMVRRIIDGISPFSPDSDHVHHRLNKLWSTRGAVLILYAVSVWFGLAAILITQFDLMVGLLIVSVTLLAAYVGIRTLGYLNHRMLPRRSRRPGAQLALNFDVSYEGDGTASVRNRELPEIRLESELTAPSGNGADVDVALLVPPVAVKSDGVKSDGVKSNGMKSDGVKSNGMKSDGTNGKTDGQSARNDGNHRRSGMRPPVEKEIRDRRERTP